MEGIKLKWLDQKPVTEKGTTWGMPWEIGQVQSISQLSLYKDETKKEVSSWPLAYWPDGSIKWSGHGVTVGPDETEGYQMVVSTKSSELDTKEYEEIVQSAMVVENETFITVNSGKLVCQIPKKGNQFIKNMVLNGHKKVHSGELVCMTEHQWEADGEKHTKETTYKSRIKKVIVEQETNNRVVIKIEGHHGQEERLWLPFVLRLYMYRNTETIKIVHTIIYDGDATIDKIKGLGIKWEAPMEGSLLNRYIRLGADTGFFSECPQFVSRRIKNYRQLYQQQLDGKKIQSEDSLDALVEDMAIWDSYKIYQSSSNNYVISKRTKKECPYIEAYRGSKGNGLAYIGDEHGGFTIGQRNFHEKHPSALEASGLASENVVAINWLWSPDSQAMDLRHYDTETHVTSSYEGFHELRSTPEGISNTSEIEISLFEETPSFEALNDHAKVLQLPYQLVCEPDYYLKCQVLGVKSIRDTSTPYRKDLEEQLTAGIDFYAKEVEQRHWYGYWNYGDVMHTYDDLRHTWKYDVGGYAWANNELVPNIWLWYSFLRSGDGTAFRLAEAMTRHTSETDVYHSGPYNMLGSRHNVLHWGCGCKEARISMAGLHKYYYYLTADERIGDIMNEVVDVDIATQDLDPMRDYFPKDSYPTHVRSGPDWASFVSNWVIRWERYQEDDYKQKILIGVKDISEMPYRLVSGPTFGYDPKTGHLYHLGEERGDGNYYYHMVLCFGATEIFMELAELLDKYGDPTFKEMYAEFAEVYLMSEAEKLAKTDGKVSDKWWDWQVFYAGASAYAAYVKQDKIMAKKVWKILLGNNQESLNAFKERIKKTNTLAIPQEVTEIKGLSTNGISQWSLGIIHALGTIGDELEAYHKENE